MIAFGQERTQLAQGGRTLSTSASFSYACQAKNIEAKTLSHLSRKSRSKNRFRRIRRSIPRLHSKSALSSIDPGSFASHSGVGFKDEASLWDDESRDRDPDFGRRTGPCGPCLSSIHYTLL